MGKTLTLCTHCNHMYNLDTHEGHNQDCPVLEQYLQEIGYGDDPYRSLNLTQEDDIFAHRGGEYIEQ